MAGFLVVGGAALRGQAHDIELRATVIAALLAGAKVADLVRKHDLPHSTITSWREQAIAEITREPGARARSRETLIDLVTELVTESIRSLTAQSRITGTDPWITQQGADGLAQYRGVEFDRIIRLLAAFRPAEPDIDHPALEAAAGTANPSPVLSS